MIRAGIPAEANPHSGEWVFVDPGFAEKAKSCGLLRGNGEPEDVSFSELRDRLLELVVSGAGPLNLLIEAPLSIAFNDHGNPVGRAIEKRGSRTRYWYVGPGSSVLVATTYLLRALHDAKPRREVCLFEGFASFKPKGERSSHALDVVKLRSVIWGQNSANGRILSAEDLADPSRYALRSAFIVAGMDFGIPAAVVLGDDAEA